MDPLVHVDGFGDVHIMTSAVSLSRVTLGGTAIHRSKDNLQQLSWQKSPRVGYVRTSDKGWVGHERVIKQEREAVKIDEERARL